MTLRHPRQLVDELAVVRAERDLFAEAGRAAEMRIVELRAELETLRAACVKAEKSATYHRQLTADADAAVHKIRDAAIALCVGVEKRLHVGANAGLRTLVTALRLVASAPKP